MRSCLIRLIITCWFAGIASHIAAQGLFSFDEEDLCQMRVEMILRGTPITSICMMKRSNDEVCGSVVNEFGIKAFDFIYDRIARKTKILNVMRPLNRRILKRILCRDFTFILAEEPTKGKKYQSRDKLADGSIRIDNTKYQLSYTFIPLPIEQDESNQ